MQERSLRARSGIFGGALVMAMFVSTLGVSAHHGWGGYFDDEFEISGTVETAVSTAGPHATMKLKAPDGNVWNVVLAPPFRTQQAGLKDGMLPAGSKVTLHGHRHRDPKTFEIKTERVTFNGKVYNVYPDRR